MDFDGFCGDVWKLKRVVPLADEVTGGFCQVFVEEIRGPWGDDVFRFW